MSDDISFEITIPSDDDGYILLQCERCGEYFKITAADTRDDKLLDIYCPCCGLVSENYITEDVAKLAQSIAQNYAMDLIYNAFKDLERKTKKDIIRFKAGKKPRHEDENPIRSGIEACIDCNTYKIVSWDYSGYIKEDYNCFDDYLIDQMNSTIENM